MKDLCLTNPKLWSLIEHEHKNQINKWGVQNHNPFQWLAFATEELGELSQAISEWYYREGKLEDVVQEAVQTATLAIKVAEMFLAIVDSYK